MDEQYSCLNIYESNTGKGPHTVLWGKSRAGDQGPGYTALLGQDLKKLLLPLDHADPQIEALLQDLRL